MRFLLTLCALLMLALPAQAEESAYQRVVRTGTLRCGYIPWPPFFDVDPNTKKVSGFNVDVFDAISRFLNLKIEYIPVTVGAQVQDLKNKRVDAICGDAPWLLGTVKYLDYADPYYYQGSFLYGRASEKRIKTLADLNTSAVKFIGIDSDVSSDLVPRRFPKAKLKTLSSMADSAQILAEIAAGKADVVILDAQSAELYAKNNPGKIKLLFKNPIAVQGGSMSMNKGETDLLTMMNNAIHVALNNGIVGDIVDRYEAKGFSYFQVALPYR